MVGVAERYRRAAELHRNRLELPDSLVRARQLRFHPVQQRGFIDDDVRTRLGVRTVQDSAVQPYGMDALQQVAAVGGDPSASRQSKIVAVDANGGHGLLIGLMRGDGMV